MKMGRHTWLMMICCAIPVAGIILLPVLGLRLGGFWPLIFLLACPLSMLFMMGSHRGGHNHVGHRSMRSPEDPESSCHGQSAAPPAPGPRVLSSPPDKGQGH